MAESIRLIPMYFFGSLFISFLILYLVLPQPRVIFKHPLVSPTVYIDKDGVCYDYKRVDVQCPNNLGTKNIEK